MHDTPAEPEPREKVGEVKARVRQQIGDVATLFSEIDRAMQAEIAEVLAERERGEDVIPVVDFQDVHAGTLPAEVREAIRRRGCAVVRGTFPRAQAEQWDEDLAGYLSGNQFDEHYRGPAGEFFASLKAGRPSIYPIYWSKPQVEARQDERMNATRTFLNSLWKHESEGEVWFDPSRDSAFADRVRRRMPGDSSLGLSPHIDAGSIERWLSPAYRDVYRHIYSGNWRNYDPWDGAYRTLVDEYPADERTSVFRTFQGWTALTEAQPTDGVLHLVPIPTAITYILIRPLLDDVADDDLCGATQGQALEIGEQWHARLLEALTPIPTVQPGDTVWWHPDLIHSVGAIASAQRWGNVMYIPATPYCEKSAAYLEVQKETFLRGDSPPDYAAENYETDYPDRATVDDLTDLGRRQMGLLDW
jgi:hypothetical protein